jgi:hypothetical protein
MIAVGSGMSALRCVKGNFSTILKIQKVLERAGIHFTDDDAGEIGVRFQIGKR